MNALWNKHKNNIAILFVISFIYVLPILLVKTYYLDDMTRSLSGRGWDHDGRLLATWLMKKLTIGNQVTDIYPIGQIIASFIIALSGYILCIKFDMKGKLPVILSSILILSSPFMLENLSYRFDSITMAISILSICMPFIWYGNSRFFAISSFIGLLASLQLYQATSPSYFVILAAFITKDVRNDNLLKPIIYGVISVSSFVLAYISSAFILKYYDVSLHGRDSFITSTKNPLSTLELNFNAIKYMISTLYTSTYIAWMMPFILLFLVSFVFICAGCFIRNGVRGLCGILILICGLIATLICIPGANIVLAEPWWTARTLIGYAFALMYASMVISLVFNNSYIRSISVAAAIYPSIILASSYSSALNAQNSFTENVVALSSPIFSKDENAKLVIVGRGPESQRALRIKQSFPVLRYMIPIYINNDWAWGINYFKLYDMINSDSWIIGKERDSILSSKCTFKIIDKNKFFSIMKKNNIYIIDFSKGDCN